MSLTRKQTLDAIGRTTPVFHKIAEGRCEDERNNVFDEAFGASNTKLERETKENTEHGLATVKMIDIEMFDFSQFLNSDIGSSGRCPSPSLFSDISTPNITSPSNSFDATTSSLLSPNTTDELGSSSQIANPRLYTRNIPGGHQRYRQSDLAKGPRLLYHEPRATEFSHSSPFTVPQKPVNDAQLSSILSPPKLISTTELLRVATTPDEQGGQNPTRRHRSEDGLGAGRVERPPAKRIRRTRKVKAQTKEEEATKREKFLDRNRQAAQKCRRKKNIWVTDLRERVEFFVFNNTQVPCKIKLAKLELKALREMAAEHCRLCPNPSPELTARSRKR